MDKRLVFALAAVLAATILGGLISGLDRKLTARFQARKGPPLLQPFYDLLKLLSKKPMAINNWLGPCAAVSALAGATAIGLLVYGAHLLLVVFVQAVGAVFLVLGALSAPSPYSRIGGQRELLQILASEPLILWAVLGLGLAGSGFSVDAILAVKEPLLFSLPLVFVALSLALTIKLRKSPFDTSASHHAHQELVRGVYTEYSGSDLALIELAHWLETVFLLALMWLFWPDPWWAGVLLTAGVYLLEIIVDNISARLTWRWMLGLAWSVGLALCLGNYCMLG